MSHAVPNIYSFFNDFKTYKSYDGHIETEYESGERINIYDYFSPDVQISNTENANEICEKFKRLYKLIISINKESGSEKLYDIDFAFLNYWLNSKLRNATISNKLTIQDLITKMGNREEEFIYNDFNLNIYNIKYEDFNNMTLLSNLYYNHSKIYQSTIGIEENIPCMEYFQEYINTYKKGIIMCPQDDTNFCKALNHFKKDYEKTFLGQDSISENCIDRERLKLPTYNNVLEEYKNNTTVGTILGSSFGTLFTLLFLYKFTPFGRWLRIKMRTNEKGHSTTYEELGQSLLDNSDTEYINADYNAYHLSYDSLGNS
ncbi:PIR Superfamily Protein [Plasmodium ovale wallikeri]|uniref:PIR Superfamily Protein n=1 Tax=Plasmodium ovale wallikeri TaxID=864142 RepID=A0A1A9AMN2_PLAOA|nr:PIR Superfamily Protein [Plasmodium ovale wallikeri]SBT58876.1 PIR Superfamily Protein [Plasmodium ovale wallikeri]